MVCHRIASFISIAFGFFFSWGRMSFFDSVSNLVSIVVAFTNTRLEFLKISSEPQNLVTVKVVLKRIRNILFVFRPTLQMITLHKSVISLCYFFHLCSFKFRRTFHFTLFTSFHLFFSFSHYFFVNKRNVISLHLFSLMKFTDNLSRFLFRCIR